MKRNRYNIAIFLMFFFNIIGSCALFSPLLKPTILLFTPFNLLFVFLLFYWANNDFSLVFIKLLAFVFALGLVVEIIGVNYKFVFGEYFYGETLGYKALGAPLIIGINWLNLSLACFGIASYLFKPKYLIILMSSFFMVLSDYLIEPIAGLLDFWYWSETEVPIKNYIAWFLISILMGLILSQYKFKLSFKLCMALLFSQLIFFIIQYFNHGLI